MNAVTGRGRLKKVVSSEPIRYRLALLVGSFGSALVGMVLHIKVPDRHLDDKSRDVVKLVMGLIATISALVLSLLISSSSVSYNQQINQFRALSANLVLLDRALDFIRTGRQRGARRTAQLRPANP